jgi:predicted ATP-grasp superfamily ATP-dependent carboligase
VGLDLARSFARSGWRVIVAEPFGMHLCRMSRAVHRSVRVSAPAEDAGAYLDQLARLVEEESVDLVVPVSEESMHVASLAGRVRSDVAVFAPPARDLLDLHDKLAFNRKAGALGLDVPRTWGADDGARPAPGTPVVLKPRHSCSGRAVRRLVWDGSLRSAADEIVQERLAGPELSAFGIARDGQLRVSVVYRARVVSGSVAVCFERLDDQADVEHWVSEFVQRSRHTGFIAFDFMRDGDGTARAIECNPRATSGIHFVDVEVLADLVTAPSAAPVSRNPYRQAGRLVESYSCFTELLGALPDWREARRILAELRQARDVSWSPRDPWPFLLMTVNTWPIIRRAMSARQSFAEVAVRDLEWRYRHV